MVIILQWHTTEVSTKEIGMRILLDFLTTISQLPLFVQMMLAVIVAGLLFALAKRLIKVILWIIVLGITAVLIYMYIR
ncbi:MAG: hypothetical protein RML40_11635 [Bacteroidota bacterium]|nr:hypothetical protein [Bacteroidota bacterium]